ncbi:MAG: hypothetical protein IJO52_06605 [Clostridia bacterium]|nr:hypothetical protein [Clostridia bacterium]
MTDFNCYIGEWPFAKIKYSTFSQLHEQHVKNGISSGWVSSVHSIFYNDPYQSEKELFEAIKGSDYRQIVTVNPTLSTAPLTLERCISDFDVCGIRLHPGYHGYSIASDVVEPVMKIAKKRNLPVFITSRMQDERFTYLINAAPIPEEDVKIFAEKYPDVKTVLSFFKLNEAFSLAEYVYSRDNVFFDTTGFVGNMLEPSETVCIVQEKSVYGSGFPLQTVTCGALQIKSGELKMGDGENKILYL